MNNNRYSSNRFFPKTRSGVRLLKHRFELREVGFWKNDFRFLYFMVFRHKRILSRGFRVVSWKYCTSTGRAYLIIHYFNYSFRFIILNNHYKNK